jgi:hypothetical protein
LSFQAGSSASGSHPKANHNNSLQAYIRSEIGKNMVRYSGLSVWIAGGFSNVEGFEKKKNSI